MARSAFYNPLKLLPEPGRWLLRLAQETVLAAGRCVGVLRLIDLGAIVFFNWSDCPASEDWTNDYIATWETPLVLSVSGSRSL